MKARDVMTTSVVTIPPDTPFRRIVELMDRHGVSALPVVAPAGELLGIVSEADLMMRAAGDSSRRHSVAYMINPAPDELRRKLEGLVASEVMTTDVVCMSPDVEVRDLARLMEWNGVKRIPVVQEGRIIGIVSRSDVLRVFLRSDEEILREITEQVLPECVADPSRLRVEVDAGTATISGSVSADELEALSQRLDAVAGIVAVTNTATSDRSGSIRRVE